MGFSDRLIIFGGLALIGVYAACKYPVTTVKVLVALREAINDPAHKGGKTQ